MTETDYQILVKRALRNVATKIVQVEKPLGRHQITHLVSGRIRGVLGADTIIYQSIRHGIIAVDNEGKYVAGPDADRFVIETRPRRSGPTTLYRFWDTNSRLLYIGISSRGPIRWKQHQNEKDWWHEVKFATMQHFDSRSAAEQAEIEAVIIERPKYNIVYANRECHQ